MDLPKSVLSILADVAERFTSEQESEFPGIRKAVSDTPAAVREAEAAIRTLPEFAELADALVSDAIRTWVYEECHKVTKKRNRDWYAAKSKPKIKY
jgi:hypothetical protein